HVAPASRSCGSALDALVLGAGGATSIADAVVVSRGAASLLAPASARLDERAQPDSATTSTAKTARPIPITGIYEGARRVAGDSSFASVSPCSPGLLMFAGVAV